MAKNKAPPTEAGPSPAPENPLNGPMSVAAPLLSVPGLEGAGVAGFTADRDSYLSQSLPDGVAFSGVLPESEEAFYARDPFSADYADFLKSKGAARRTERRARVDEGLRASLLERPFLMEKPEEAAHRGATAVWRSLKDQLKQESHKIIDDSDASELQALESELASRQALVSAVGKGIDMLLKRLRQRLHDAPAPTAAAAVAVAAAPAAVPAQTPDKPAKPKKQKV